jgi:large subunit ribosomal protein L31
MNTAIHPKWYSEAKVSCACGNTFTLGATVPEIQVEVCYQCHPYYTGQMKFLDTAGRVDAFRARQKAANKKVLSKAERRKIKRAKKIREQMDRPDTLSALRASLKKESRKKKKSSS